MADYACRLQSALRAAADSAADSRNAKKNNCGRCRKAPGGFVLGVSVTRSLRAKGHSMADKQKFMVLYLIPAAVMDDWAKTDPAVRQPAEQKMQQEWGA